MTETWPAKTSFSPEASWVARLVLRQATSHCVGTDGATEQANPPEWLPAAATDSPSHFRPTGARLEHAVAGKIRCDSGLHVSET